MRIVNGCLLVAIALEMLSDFIELAQSEDRSNLLLLIDFPIEFCVVVLLATLETFLSVVRKVFVVSCSVGFLEVAIKMPCGPTMVCFTLSVVWANM